MLTAVLVGEEQGLHELRHEWDRLAVACGRPFCAPAWMRAWWRHASPPGSALRVVAVWKESRLVALAPFYCQPDKLGLTRYRQLAASVSLGIGPLGLGDHQLEAARLVAATLDQARPRPDIVEFEGIAGDSLWPSLLRSVWPRPRAPWLHTERVMPAPTIDLRAGSYEDWFASRSRNFRQQTRRRRRQLEAQGAAFRMVRDPLRLPSALESFSQLHHGRWQSKGGSAVLSPGVETMLLHAGQELLADGRFQLWSIQVDGRDISSHLFVSAGGVVAYWLGGFDERWAWCQPSMQALTAAVEHAWKGGSRRIELGGGDQAYKYRLADAETTVRWTTLVPRTSRYVPARARLLPRHASRAVLNRLTADSRDRIKRLLGRSPGGPTREQYIGTATGRSARRGEK